MIAQEVFDIPATVITGPADLMDRPRSSGLHLSQIYGDIDAELGANAKYKDNPMPLAQLEVYRSAGFIWEHAMDLALAKSLESDEWVRPQEFNRDGISGSPDLIGLTDWVLGETKYTWKSSKNFDELIAKGTGKLWVWTVQMKGYCHMIGTNKARLFAFFVNGDYRNYQPQFRVADFVFNSRELRENWNMITAHAVKKGWL